MTSINGFNNENNVYVVLWRAMGLRGLNAVVETAFKLQNCSRYAARLSTLQLSS